MNTERNLQSPGAERNQEIPREELNPEDMAARAATLGPQYDAAITQLLRELLWARLVETKDPDGATKVLPVIVSARKQAAAEAKSSKENEIITESEEKDALDQIVGPPLNKK